MQAIAAGDILWVPHTIGTRIHDFINKSVYVNAGATYSATYAVRGAKYYGDAKDDNTGHIVP